MGSLSPIFRSNKILQLESLNYSSTYASHFRIDKCLILQSDIALLYLENGFDLNSPFISKINIADSQPAAGSSVTVAGKVGDGVD